MRSVTSADVCFKYIADKPGLFVDIDTGKTVGEHQGFHKWTLGQRSRIQGVSEAYYICKKSTDNNVIYVVCVVEFCLKLIEVVSICRPRVQTIQHFTQTNS